MTGRIPDWGGQKHTAVRSRRRDAPLMREHFYFMEAGIERINDYVFNVSHNVHYWMVRTMGGEYYHEFIEKGFIAIGYNEIALSELEAINPEDYVAVNQLRSRVIEVYSDMPKPGQIVTQLLRFCKQIRVGDVIVLPGYSSHEISLCRVRGNVYEETNTNNRIEECAFAKRLPIEVVRTTTRRSLPPKAQMMFNSRHAISNIDYYAMYIDNSMMDYYDKDDETHVVLKIDTDDEVPASAFFDFYNLMCLTERFCQENDIEGTAKDTVMKVQMESKGMLHFVSSKKTYLALLALGILFINGGGLKVHYGNFDIDLSTQGVFGAYSEYLDRKMDREVKQSIKNSLDTLKIKTPEDFMKASIELYKAQNANRKKY